MFCLNRVNPVRYTFQAFVVRKCHSQGPNNKNIVSSYVNKVLDNPLPLGVGALVVGILQLKRIREREKRKELSLEESGATSLAEPWQVTCYRSLPLRHISRLWGYVNDIYLPAPIRNFVLSAYVKTFGCDLTEAENSDLTSYPNLGEFFRRRLRDGVRPVEEGECMVSPCDGKVLHWGSVKTGGLVEQVKGVSYELDHFLGQSKNPTGVNIDSCSLVSNSLPSESPSTCLYQCVLYLAPGDYHCFHAPVDWNICTRRHFPGELLSVSPGIVSRIQGLFSLNERVAYLGRWKHGFFSMTAVGATNVGSVKVGMDPDLVTNVRKWESDTFHQKVWEGGFDVKKGEYFGEFNLGSTIILIFEAPMDFKFEFTEGGEIVKMGRVIGKSHNSNDAIEVQKNCDSIVPVHNEE